MQQPAQITFKDLEQSDELTDLVHEKTDKLQQFFENIISCHVVIEQTQKHKNQGKLHNVRINLGVPGKELIVTNNERENVYIAVRDAFDNLRRQLEDHARKAHGDVKPHPEMVHGKIVRLFEDFGFIEGTNGTEYYFNEDNLVHPKFNKLKVGSSVRFIEAVGDDGLQAHRVSATPPSSD